MPVRILPNDGTKKNTTGDLITLGDNGCLPVIIAKTFGWEAVQIEFTDNNDSITTFGACRIGMRIVLLPHFSYGPYSTPGAVESIFNALKSQGYTCEWRLTKKASDFVFTDKLTTLLPLLPDSEDQFNLLDSNVKRKIRKCERNGINVKIGKTELLPDFYEIYSRNMHRLGSPALPKRWFAALLSQYQNGKAALWCAYLDDKPVGAAFMLEYKGFYEACWASTLHQYNSLYTSYGLYWQMIAYAVEHKGIHFSFGRSSLDSGVHKFKQQWGGVDLQLYWNYSHPQVRNVRNLTFLPKLWKLLPYRFTRLVGPLVAGRFY